MSLVSVIARLCKYHLLNSLARPNYITGTNAKISKNIFLDSVNLPNSETIKILKRLKCETIKILKRLKCEMIKMCLYKTIAAFKESRI